MSSKKKLIISLSVAAAVLVAAIIAIVAVFAAGTQAVKSGITVRFTASDDVSCTIVGNWALENAEESASPAQKGKIGELTITAAETDETKTHNLSAENLEVELTKAQNHVDFSYTITNIGQTAFTVTLKQAITHDALDVTYLVDNTEISEADITSTGTVIAAKGQEGASKTLTIRVEIPAEEMGNDVTLEADILWNLAV